MNLIAEEGIFLCLMSPLGIGIGIFPGAITFAFAGAGLLAEFIGVGPDVSGIGSGIPAQDYLQGNRLSDQIMEYLVEGIISQTIAEVGEGAIGRGLEEVKVAEETKSGTL